MDDDFNTPEGLACIFELVNLANKNIDDSEFLYNARNTLRELMDILGISLKAAETTVKISDEEIKARLLEREKARQESNYALSDKIRKELEEKGVILEDTKEGTTWRRKL